MLTVVIQFMIYAEIYKGATDKQSVFIAVPIVLLLV